MVDVTRIYGLSERTIGARRGRAGRGSPENVQIDRHDFSFRI
jgi:hypothetical protein